MAKSDRSARPQDRMIWLLRYIVHPARGIGGGFVVAWDEEAVSDFVRAFPEAEKCLVMFTLGPDSSPMLNAAAKRAKDAGYLWAGHIGNMEARRYNQRTWCRTWSITDAGRRFLRELDLHAAEAALLPEGT